MSQDKQRSSCSNTAPSMPLFSDEENERLPRLSPNLIPNLLTAISVVSNVVLQPAANNGAVLEDELQLPYVGHIGVSTSTACQLVDFELPITGSRTDENPINASNFELHEVESSKVYEQRILEEYLDGIMGSATEAAGPVSNSHVGAEIEAATSRIDNGGAIEVEGSGILLAVSPCPDLTTLPCDGYDSADEFQSTPPSSSQGKAKAQALQMGAGSSGIGGSTGGNSRKQVKRPCPSSKKQAKEPNTGNDGCPTLRKMLAMSVALPAQGSTSGPKNKVGRPKKQVKSGLATSAEPAVNIAEQRAGCSRATLPAPEVVRAPIIDLVDSDVESEVFSQDSVNVISAYRLLRDRIRREHAEHRANVQRSEEDFKRVDAEFRRAEEARRVAFDTLERHRRALDRSSKKLNKISEGDYR